MEDVNAAIPRDLRLTVSVLMAKQALVKFPAIDFPDDENAKPVGIRPYIGRLPIAAFGNSDGDLQRLPWSAADFRPVK